MYRSLALSSRAAVTARPPFGLPASSRRLTTAASVSIGAPLLWSRTPSRSGSVATPTSPMTGLAAVHCSRFHTSAALANILPPQREITSALSDSDYHRHADATLERLLEALETLGDEIELAGYDVTYSSGVLNVKLGVHGTYVLNKQPPNKQVWMSSPVSGPRRFDWCDVRRVWVDARQEPKVADEIVEVVVNEFDELLEVDLEGYLPPLEH